MTWNREDTKDVLRKALGTIIGAALISLATAVYDVLDIWVLSIILFAAAAIIFIFLWRAKEKGSKAGEAFAGDRIESQITQDQPQREVPKIVMENRTIIDERPIRGTVQEEPGQPLTHTQERIAKEESKLKKKALKAEMKAKKKGNKEKEKSD